MTDDTRPAGWGWPGLAGKAHWFDAGEIKSLCGKWLFTGHRDPETRPSPNDCLRCRRLLEARKDTT